MTPTQTQLKEAREELELREMALRDKRREIEMLGSELATLESIRDGAQGRFNQLRAQELLEERERLVEARRQNSEEAQPRPVMTAQEHNAFPGGRW